MKKNFSLLTHRLYKNPLLYGSALVFMGTMAGNLFQFLFNLFMSRNLSIADYGILASLVSLITLPSLVSNAIFPTVVSFAATYYAANKIPMVKKLFVELSKFSFVAGLIIFLCFFIFSEQIGNFFQIDDSTLITLAGINVFLGFLMIVTSALLQAKLAFSYVSFINFFSSLLKFAAGALLVLMGMNVAGAMWGMIIASVGGYLTTFYPLRELFSHKISDEKINISALLNFAAPAALIFFSLTSFITVDIILVKHFFSPHEAGLYAGLSLVGRIIFFVSSPVSLVILPLLTQENAKNKNVSKEILLALALVAVPSTILTAIYFMYPDFIISFFLKNEEYTGMTNYLGLFALFITCYSLVFVLSNVFLSLKRTIIYIPLSIAAICQAVLIWFFHETFLQVIYINFITISILLLVLLLYYWSTQTKMYGEKK